MTICEYFMKTCASLWRSIWVPIRRLRLRRLAGWRKQPKVVDPKIGNLGSSQSFSPNGFRVVWCWPGCRSLGNRKGAVAGDRHLALEGFDGERRKGESRRHRWAFWSPIWHSASPLGPCLRVAGLQGTDSDVDGAIVDAINGLATAFDSPDYAEDSACSSFASFGATWRR